MQAIQLLHPLHNPGPGHLYGAARRQFLGVLEEKAYFAVKLFPLRRQKSGCTKKHGRMAIMAAGMHDSRHPGSKRQFRLLLNGQSIYISPYGNGASRISPFEYRNHPRPGGGMQFQSGDLPQFLQQKGRGLYFLKGKLRMHMEMPPPGDTLRQYILYFRAQVHILPPPFPS